MMSNPPDWQLPEERKAIAPKKLHSAAEGCFWDCGEDPQDCHPLNRVLCFRGKNCVFFPVL